MAIVKGGHEKKKPSMETCLGYGSKSGRNRIQVGASGSP
jgi:hypothetical protein